MQARAPVHYEGTSCALSIKSLAAGVILLTIQGHDVGEFGSEPMSQLEAYLPGDRPAELHIDARRTRGASLEVSGEWAQWLSANRSRFERISMLTGSRFIEITAGFVRRFSGLQDIMRIYTDAEAFDDALGSSVAGESEGR